MRTEEKKKTYEKLRADLEEAKQFIGAIRRGEVDTIYTDEKMVGSLRLEKLELVEERNRLLKELAENNMKLKIALHKNNQLAAAIEQTAEMVIITDKEGAIEYVNPAFEKITGYVQNEVIGANPRILRSGRHDQAFYEKLWETIAKGKIWSGHIINKKKSGELYDEELTISPIYDSGKIAHYVGIKRDISEKIKLQRQLCSGGQVIISGNLCGRDSA